MGGNDSGIHTRGFDCLGGFLSFSLTSRIGIRDIRGVMGVEEGGIFV